MYKLIEFPEIQKYQELEGFDEHACLANDPRFLQINGVGNSAYFVDTEWLTKMTKEGLHTSNPETN